MIVLLLCMCLCMCQSVLCEPHDKSIQHIEYVQCASVVGAPLLQKKKKSIHTRICKSKNNEQTNLYARFSAAICNRDKINNPTYLFTKRYPQPTQRDAHRLAITVDSI